MKKKWIIPVILVLAAGVIYMTFFKSKREINVLVFSKTEGFRHSSIEVGQEAIKDLGKKHGFSVDITEDAEVFNEEDLSKYNVLIFLNTTGDILNETQQIEMNRFIQAGGGFVGIHSAADTEYKWPWYNKLVGAYFQSHPPGTHQATIHKVDNEFTATSHLPSEWSIEDEWYNYKDIIPEMNVLLNLDESTYEGGENGENHPISWYREFDGGRMFYTGLGHREEIFADENFLNMLWGGIDYVAGEGQPVNYAVATVGPEENRFSKVVLGDNLNEPMELEILPNRDLLFVQRDGDMILYSQEEKAMKTVATINVTSELEDGLLGLTKDPDYETNHWIYLFYSPAGDIPKQHVSRFVFKDGTLDMDSEKVILEIPTQRDQCCHSAGSLEFGPNGNLFISTGDNTSPRTTGYSPADEREGRSPWDAQKSSANTNDLRGKILRIKPEDDGTYSIPDGNLFAKDGSEGKPEIFVMGCRNPYRMSIDSKTGYLYWGEVGPDAGEDSLGRGPMGHDEVNQAKKAGFYGWPYFVGDNKPYYDVDFASMTASEKPYDPEKPVNLSPNNTGAKELPPAQKAFIWYPYGPSPEFPLVGEGSRNAMAGPVFHYADYPDSDNKFPEYYDGKLFTYDWMRGWIMAVTMDEEGNFQKMERFLPSFTFNNLIDIVMGPDGDMFMLEYGTNWFSQNKDARLVHLQYVAGNRKPVAKIAADKTIGSAPLTIAFNGETSVDFDGDPLTYKWSFNSDDVQSEEANPTFTFDKPGTYTVKLEIRDPDGEIASTEQEVLVGNDLPQLAWSLTGNKTFYFDNEQLSYEVSVSDAEDGSTSDGSITAGEVAISMDFLERGFDKTIIAQGHQMLKDASDAFVGKALIEKSDCKACHQENEKSVGPTYRQISDRYKNDNKAIANLSQKIIKGGGGVWGEVFMAAHPSLSTSEAEQMVKYILSLTGNPNAADRLPLKGTFTTNDHIGKGNEGTYIFTASYTDKGGDQVGPLTASEVITLRSPFVPAYTHDGTDKAMTFDVTPDMAPQIKEAITLVIGNKGSYIQFNQLDFTGIESVDVLATASSLFASGGLVEFRADSKDGELIGSMDLESTLSISMDVDPVSVKLKPMEGKHDLYIVFKGVEDGNKPVCALFSLEFKAGKAI